jgi:DNA-binding CsgD family transcriptional regulator
LFELTHAQWGAGEHLRRARRRADARPHLTSAYVTFAALGAEHWAARAAHELRAAGGRRGERSPNDGLLTARERDVCRLVAGGATNREVAAALHMSPRTVEHHLRMAYRKLGVRSRTEMTGRFGGDVDTESSSPA